MSRPVPQRCPLLLSSIASAGTKVGLNRGTCADCRQVNLRYDGYLDPSGIRSTIV